VGPSGQGVYLWGHSHNMPVKHFPKLEADPGNFSPRCQNWMGEQGCHEKLDDFIFSGIKDFQDLDEIMFYRREHDKYSYNQFVRSLIEVGCYLYDYID